LTCFLEIPLQSEIKAVLNESQLKQYKRLMALTSDFAQQARDLINRKERSENLEKLKDDFKQKLALKD